MNSDCAGRVFHEIKNQRRNSDDDLGWAVHDSAEYTARKNIDRVIPLRRWNVVSLNLPP